MAMSLKIGLDFDNTIINYENLFFELLKSEHFISADTPLMSKTEVKKYLIGQDKNDLRWQALQAKAYGENINQATCFEGVFPFIKWAKQQGHQISIVSHKTETSNYDHSVKLRYWATKWMEENKLIGVGPQQIDPSEIHFVNSVDEKISSITAMKFDLFVDDLPKIIEHHLFPKETLGILFAPSSFNSNTYLQVSSWPQLKNQVEQITLIGKNAYQFVCQNLKRLPDTVEQINQSGNNRLFKINFKEKALALKTYYNDPKSDQRNRGKTEYEGLKLLWDNGIRNIPCPLDYLDQHQLGLYQFIVGEKITPHTSFRLVEKSIQDFIVNLYQFSQNIAWENLSEGADSRKCLGDYLRIIERRTKDLKDGVQAPEIPSYARHFLEQEVLPLGESICQRFIWQTKQNAFSLEEPFPKQYRIFSPSDLGLHNTLFPATGDPLFLDFEYCGLDDLIKLTSDFFHHVAQDIPWESKWRIFKNISTRLPPGAQFQKRFDLCVDMIGYEWVLIVLNIMRSGVIERRKFSSPQLNVEQLVQERLQKAALMIGNIKSYRQKQKIYHTIPECQYE